MPFALLLLKCLLSTLLLGYLLYQTDLALIWNALKSASLLWVIVAFLLHIIGFLISAYRWQLLLRTQGAEVSIGFLIKSYLVGIFFNNFLPSTVGGDVIRAYDTAPFTRSGTQALTIVMVERLTGMFALGLFALIALLFGFLGLGARIPMVWLALGALLIMFIMFGVVLHPRVSKSIDTFLESWSRNEIDSQAPTWDPAGKLRAGSFLNKGVDKLKKLFGTLSVYGKNKRVLVIAFLLAVLLQINVIFHFYVLSFALKLPIPLLYYFLIIPVITVVLLLPVFINGIGAREAIYVFFLGQFQVTPPEAIAFTWLSFGMVLIQGIIGGIIYAVRR